MTKQDPGFFIHNGQNVAGIYEICVKRNHYPDMPKDAIGKTFLYDGATYTVRGLYMKGLTPRSKTIRLDKIVFLCEVGMEEMHTFSIDFISGISLAEPII